MNYRCHIHGAEHCSCPAYLLLAMGANDCVLEADLERAEGRELATEKGGNVCDE